MKFIGIDLGWQSGQSGLCCLQADRHYLHLLDVTRRLSLTDIFTWLDDWVEPGQGAMVAVDAPTLIPNQTGTRLPDRLTHLHFGKYHAGCYPANLGRPFAQRTIAVGLDLEARGFAHAPTITPQIPGRYQIEVFPHPAMIRLFQLERIIKYKKGTLSARKQALMQLQHCIKTYLSQLTPTLKLDSLLSQSLWRSPLDLTGKELKALEDQLDSLMCAYIGAYWWYWGLEGNQVLGDERSGYIIVPDLTPKT
ncbi:MAG: hypothetical protein RLZZ568_823 [Cyanobacteriota bacterium]|jgi:predicted RNase H-like nuclease